LVLFFLIEDFWLVLNSIYFLYFNNYFHILNFLFHLQTNFSSINEGISFLSAVNAIGWVSRFSILLIDIVPFIIMLNSNIFENLKILLKSKIPKLIWISTLIALIISEIFSNISGRGIMYTFSKLFKEGLSSKEEKELIKRYGTIFVNFLDIFYIINEDIIYRNVDYGQKIEFNGNERKNIIVIQVESLDSSILNTYYKGIPIVPFLRNMTTNSMFYPIVISYHFAGYSSDAEFTVLNSLHPLKDIPSIRYWKDYKNSIAKVFKSNNYLVYAFHNNRSTFFGREEGYRKMGFDKFFDIEEMKLEEKGWGASDEDTLEYVKIKLKTIKNTNFFIYIITMSSHGPFTFVKNYYTNDLFEDIQDEITKNYFNSMNYVDKVISNFVKFVEKEIPNTILIIFGDHHSSVQDSNYYKRSVSYLNSKIIEIVPLFIIGHNQKKIITTPISQLDIPPTILKLAGIKGSIRSKGEVVIPHPKKETIFFLGENISKNEIIQNLNFPILDYIHQNYILTTTKSNN
ncbi:MAG: LTA synthase family protein, partial [Brevinematia bacterium]